MTSDRLRAAFLGALIASLPAGCADPGRLFKMHTAPDRRADAEKSWRGVRATVKLQLAQELLDGGNPKEARAALQEVAGASGDDAAVLLMLAKIELADAHLASARQAISSVLAMPQPSAEAYYVAGLIDERYENYADAAKAYESAALSAPQEPDYVVARAEALVKLNRPVEAIKSVEERLADFPESVELRLFVADTNQMLGLKDAAVAAYRDAERLSNDDPRVRAQLGLALEGAGKDEEAIRVLLPLVGVSGIAGDRAPAASRGGRPGSRSADAKRRGEPSESKPGSEKDSAAPSKLVRRALARALLRNGMPKQARVILAGLLVDEPKDIEGWALMTRVAFALGDAQLAREAAERLAALDGNPHGWLLGAYAAMKSGDSKGALRNVSEALNNNPRDVMALCMLACVQAEAGEKTAAARTLDHALRIDPDCGPAVQLRRQLTSDPPAAAPMPREVSRQDPDASHEEGAR